MSTYIDPQSTEHWLKLRTQDVTSTESSALFNLCPYLTEYELWYLKSRGMTGDFEANERMVWGDRLEASIAEGVCEDNNWSGHPFKSYGRIQDKRMGSSFDYLIETPEGNGLLEIKNVDSLIFKQKWLDNDGNVEAPPHIEIQVQHQLAVTGFSFAYIAALVGGNNLVLSKRTRNDKVISAIEQKVEKFWESIDSGNPPEPDYKRDADFIARLYNYAEPESILDVGGESHLYGMAQQYQDLSEKIKDLEKEKKGIKAAMLMEISDYEKVIHSDFTITAGMVGESEVSYTRKPYRNFRVHWRK